MSADAEPALPREFAEIRTALEALERRPTCAGCGSVVVVTDDGVDGHDDNCEVAFALDRLADLAFACAAERRDGAAPPPTARETVLIAALEAARIDHTPLGPDCEMIWPGPNVHLDPPAHCTCGADEHNAAIDAALGAKP